MIVDAHQHFWRLARGDYPWPNDTVAPIFRDFTPADLEPLLARNGVDKTVLVQATDTVAETEYLLEIAASAPHVCGVVGWVDLSAEDAVQSIDRLRQNPLLKGLRPMLQGIDDPNWILQDAVQPALAHMAAVGLTFDALIQPRHLPAIAAMAERHFDLRIVVDHAAKPKMGQGQVPDTDWMIGLTQLSELPNLWCKLSGLVTEVGEAWDERDILPFAKHVLGCFGPDRTLFGSDWPVVNLASDYGTWIDFVTRLISGYAADSQAKIMGGNAVSFYRL